MRAMLAWRSRSSCSFDLARVRERRGGEVGCRAVRAVRERVVLLALAGCLALLDLDLVRAWRWQ